MKICIKNAVIFLTHQCNLRCTYCPEDHNRTENISLKTIDDCFAFIKKSQTLSTTTIEMFGGEPTLNKEGFLYALKRCFTDPDLPNIFFSMTNGRFLDESYVREIRKILNYPINTYKTFSFRVSIDNIDNTVKNLKDVEPALKILEKYNIPYCIATVINKTNYKNLYNFVKEALKFNPYSVNLQRLCNTSIWKDNDIKIIEQQCIKIINNLNCNRIVFPGKYSIKYNIEAPCAIKQHQQYSIYFFDTNGDIYPCEFCTSNKKYKIGSIYDPEHIKPKKFDVDYYTPTGCMLEQYPGNKEYEDMCERVKNYLIAYHNTKQKGTIMQGIPNETALAIHITDKCNLKCPGCYTLDKPRNNVINYDYIKLALDKYKPKDVVFFGGEAILEPDIIRKTMAEYPHIRYSLHTNGSNFNESNKDIYDKLYKIVLSLDSYNPEWLKKYKGYTDKDVQQYMDLLKTYPDKISVTHNVFASHNDPDYVKGMEEHGFITDWYLFVTKARDQEFLQCFRDYMTYYNWNINTMPKLRLLTDGTITRDMRGVYNLFHVTEWDDSKLNEPLPISDKCRQCKFNKRCHAYSMFPHFVKDILDNIDYEPHFCKFTKIFWRYNPDGK